jgi:hypothetical protein
LKVVVALWKMREWCAVRTEFEERGKELEVKIRKEYEETGELERTKVEKEFRYILHIFILQKFKVIFSM